MANLVELMQTIAENAMEASKPASIAFGTVISASPLKIQIDQKLTLTDAQLIPLRHVTDYETELSFDDPAIKNVVKPYSMADEAGTNYKITFQTQTKNKVTIYNGLKLGDSVLLLRAPGGQKYVIWDKVG